MVLRLVFSLVAFSAPITVDAGIFSTLSEFFGGKNNTAAVVETNSQRMPVLEAKTYPDMDLAKGGGDIVISGGTTLTPESGPIGSMADIDEGNIHGTISLYTVHKGDTVQSIARMFGVSPNTVIWANEIKNSVIHEGDQLIILPISGVQHSIKKGDTLESIAKQYKADAYDIARYNGMSPSDKLAIGETLIVPDGEIASPVTKVAVSSSKVRGANGPSYEGYYLRPVLGGTKSQGLHGYNGIDLATYMGAPIFASAEGEVLISMKTGWNGGYGKYIVISHPNGTQTLYAHNLDNYVNTGDWVVKGQIIGLVGSTGKSTGPHVHFEVRGAKNPF